MMLHGQLLHVAETGKISFGMQVSKLLDGIALKQPRCTGVEFGNQLAQSLGELARGVGRGIFCRRDEMVNEHDVVLVRIDKRQMDCDSVGWPSAFFVIVAYDQE